MPRAALRLSPLEAPLYVTQLRALVAVARPSALFPDGGRLDAWLQFLVRPRRAGKAPSLEVELKSGLPTRRMLKGLLALQVVAQEFLATFRISPQRPSDAFSVALARAELPALSSTQAQLVARERGGARFALVHDRLDAATGCLTRYTAQLSQRGATLVSLGRGEQASVSTAGARWVEAACQGHPDEVAALLSGQDGVSVTEVARAQLGPLWSAAAPGTAAATAEGRALWPVLAAAPEPVAVLSLLLERAGAAVALDRCADGLGALDCSPPALARRAALGFHLARERRLICTPAAEAPLRAWLKATGGGAVVRSA